MSDNTLKAIHQCVIHSVMRHVLTFSPEKIIEYLTTYPFFRGSDTLYYFILRKVGALAYYAPNGHHILSIQPELSGVYVLAEQDMKAPLIKDVPEPTIQPIIIESIVRMVTCPRYKLRHSIITGEAEVKDAVKIPSIALNISRYQSFFQNVSNHIDLMSLLIDQDCWEPISSLNYNIMTMMISRMSYIVAIAPELWELSLRQYYTQRLVSLEICQHLPSINNRQLNALNKLLPDLIKSPPNFNTLSVRLWFTDRTARAYLLGFDLNNGVPSDEIISERIQHLQRIGIEKYAEEITGIHVAQDNRLTGYIGNIYYDYLAGKQFITSQSNLTKLGASYVYDLIHVIIEDQVHIIKLWNIITVIDKDRNVTPEYIREIFASGIISDVKGIISFENAQRITAQLTAGVGTNRGISAHTRLVEILSHDLIDY